MLFFIWLSKFLLDLYSLLEFEITEKRCKVTVAGLWALDVFCIFESMPYQSMPIIYYIFRYDRQVNGTKLQ